MNSKRIEIMKKIVVLWFIYLLVACNTNDDELVVKSGDNLKNNNLDIVPNDEIVKDIDGNEYKTIKANDLVWMTSNLKTKRFSNGDLINEFRKDSQWKSSIGPGYCLFNNDKEKLDFGNLYNLAAVIDKRNICPKGWRLPTKEETIWNNNIDLDKVLNHPLFNNKILGWRRIDDNEDDDEYNGFWFESRMKSGVAIYWLAGSYLDDNYDTENPNDKIIRGYTMESGTIGEYGFGNKFDGYSCRCVKDSI